jgi:large subunit ribosomal protein L21
MPYAIFSHGGRQFRAEPGRTLKIPRVQAEPGATLTFDDVRFANDGKGREGGTVGTPSVKGAKVTAEVLRHGRGEKLRIFRFARRSGYRRHAGHRQDFTEIKISGIKVG